jgi:hypothetical protein
VAVPQPLSGLGPGAWGDLDEQPTLVDLTDLGTASCRAILTLRLRSLRIGLGLSGRASSDACDDGRGCHFAYSRFDGYRGQR